MVQTGFSKERGIQLGESRRQGFLADVKKQQGHGRRGGQRVRAWGRVVRTWGPPSLLVPELRHGQTSFRVLGGGVIWEDLQGALLDAGRGGRGGGG